MDSRHLRYFVALAETLHFGNAAARMNMTQPPFSRQIANLERDLGARLVERNSRQVRLTTAGAHFLKDARRILAEIDSACRDARLIAEGRKGELRLGFMMHAADRVLPELVSRYRAACPEVRVTLREIPPSEIEMRLVQGEIDAGVTFAGRAVPSLAHFPLLTEPLRLIVPAGHRLAGAGRVSARDLQAEEIIVAPAGVAGALREAVTGYFLAAGLVPRIGLEPGLQHSIVRLVAAGLGVALVPASVCATMGPGLAAVALEAAPTLEVILMTQAQDANPAVAALARMLREPA